MPSELPHGAIVDDAQKTLTITMGSVAIKFSFEEWHEFVEIIDDINLVFQTNLESTAYQCSTCGTINAAYDYIEPADEEIN